MIKTCEYCKNHYPTKRQRSKFCSATCRAKDWKKKNVLKSQEPKMEENELMEHQICKMAQLLLQFHQPNYFDFEEEIKDRIWSIDNAYEDFSTVTKEIKFRLKYGVSKEDYSSIAYRISLSENRTAVTEADLLNHFGHIPKRKQNA